MPLENALVPDSTPTEGDLSIGQDLNYDPSQTPPDAQPVADYTSHDPSHPEYMQPTDATPPSPKEAKFVKYDEDGSAVFSNGVKYLPNGSIRWEDRDTGTIFEQKNPYVKAVTIGKKKDSPSDESDKLLRDSAARKGIVPSKYPLGEKDPAYQKAAQMALNPNALGDATSDTVGEDSLTGLSDADKATVRLMADYKWPIPPGGIRNPKQLALLQRAAQFDPTFAPAEYTIRQKSKMDYTSGASMKNIRSLNTLAGHLDNLSKSADGLGNTNNSVLNLAYYNTIGNALSSASGNPKVKVFESDVNAVTNELGQLLRGGAVTDQEAKRWQSAINSSESPDQLHAVIHEFADLAKSRLDALQQGYEGVMRKPSDIQIMTPKAKASFMKLGVLSQDEVANTAGGAKGFGAQPSATPQPSPVSAQYPIGTKARKGDVWHTMTDHGWEPPL